MKNLEMDNKKLDFRILKHKNYLLNLMNIKKGLVLILNKSKILKEKFNNF
jgi:hypothetical protein